MNPSNGSELLTLDAVCALLGVGRKSVRRFVRDRKLSVVRFSKTAPLRFRECDVRQFIENHRVPVSAGTLGKRRGCA